MKIYIIVNLLGAAKDKITLILETDDYTKMKEMVEKAGFGDYKILYDWKMVRAKIIK